MTVSQQSIKSVFEVTDAIKDEELLEKSKSIKFT